MKKKVMNAETIFSFLLILLGAYVMVLSSQYGIWAGINPDKGFMPFLASTLMTICSVLWFIQSLRAGKAKDEGGSSTGATFSLLEIKWLVIVPAVCLAVVLLSRYLGMIMSLALLMFCWFKFISKFSWLKSLCITVLLTVVFYLVFVFGLKVPFPKFFGLF